MGICAIALGYLLLFVLGLLMFSVSNSSLSHKSVKYMLFLATISLSVLAYHTVAVQSDDLYRYFFQMDIFRTQGLDYAIIEGPWGNTPLSTLILYLFSLTGDNHLLPMFTTLVIWGGYLYIICDVLHYKYGSIPIRKLFVYLLALIFVTNIYGTISGVRAPLGSVVVVWAIYLDFSKKRKISWLLYLAAVLCHVHYANILIIRLIMGLSVNKKRKGFLLVGVLLVYFVGFQILEHSSLSYLQHLSEKTQMYSGFAENGVGWFISKILLFSSLVLFALSIKPTEKISYEQIEFTQALLLFNLVMLFVYDYIPMRLQAVSLMTCLPLAAMAKRNKVVFRIALAIFILWMFIDLKYEIALYSRWLLE